MKKGILLLSLFYVVGVSAIVAGELSSLNGIKRSLGEPEIAIAEYFSDNAVRIFSTPWQVVHELREENRRLNQLWLEKRHETTREILESLAYRGGIKKGSGETPSQKDKYQNRNWVEKKPDAAKERSAAGENPPFPYLAKRETALNITLLRSYSELL